MNKEQKKFKKVIKRRIKAINHKKHYKEEKIANFRKILKKVNQK